MDSPPFFVLLLDEPRVITALWLPCLLLELFFFDPSPRNAKSPPLPLLWPRALRSAARLRLYWRVTLAACISRMPLLLVRSFPERVPRSLVTHPWMVDAF